MSKLKAILALGKLVYDNLDEIEEIISLVKKIGDSKKPSVPPVGDPEVLVKVQK